MITDVLNKQVLHKRVVRLMGNRFEITIAHDDAEYAQTMIGMAVAEIQRIEALLTTFKESSQANLINANAGIKPVQVDHEVYELIYRSVKISVLTQGAFDITYGSIDKRLWNFDLNMKMLPSAATAKKMVRLINYKNIIFNQERCTIFLK